MPEKQIAIIGGGAAGFFAAINCAEKNPDYRITIFEKSPKLLSKVKISGGGRCNVTHHCFDARNLVQNYPRGEKQLLGPFNRFGVIDTVAWFNARGVKLKPEGDGRMFPITDSSQTIVDCFLSEAKRLGINIKTSTGIAGLGPLDDRHKWQLKTDGNDFTEADAVILAGGSSNHVWEMLAGLGHTIITPVPSLFTFNIASELIKGLEGLSVGKAVVTVMGDSKVQSPGPLLITHWGLSGPAVLKLSARGARYFAGLNHRFGIHVNWIDKSAIEAIATLKKFKTENPKKNVSGNPQFNIPKRLWERLTGNTNINYADLSNKQIETIVSLITAMPLEVTGKSTFKDEFVTAGGVDLNEVDFKTMQSKKLPGLYFAGEVLDIDAITGGFNFQAAWTTGWVAGTSV